MTATVLLGLALGHATTAVAQQPGKRPSETPPPPSCLDQSITDELGDRIRPRGVQKKTFLKKHRFELVGRGGIFASDLVSSSYQYGGAVAWYLSEDLGFELGFDVTPVAADAGEPLADFFEEPPIFPSGTGYLATANLLWSPLHFKLKTSGGSILHGDATFAIGGGRVFHESAQGIAFDAGLVVEVFATRWLSLRFDVRDVVLVQEAIGETRLTNNLAALFGVGLWVPFGF